MYGSLMAWLVSFHKEMMCDGLIPNGRLDLADIRSSALIFRA
jgi:hypothetical protein